MSECDVASSMEVPRSIEGVVLSPIRSVNKPRRKRKKKKKKKKKRPNSEPLSSDDESLEFLLPLRYETNKTNSFQPKITTSSGESHISTPQDVLRQRLIEKDGYEAAQIEQAMEEMWERGMPFDEYESVICYLQSGYAPTLCGAATASTTSTSGLSISMTTEEEEVDLASHSQNESFSLEESVEKEECPTTNIALNGDIPTVIKENDCEKDEEEPKEPQQESNLEEYIEEPTRPTMATKLDTVASFENLTDAIFALTQWVKKAASKEETEIFCRADTTSALPTVIQRGISSESYDTARFESAVQPALVLLLMAVMSRCGIDELKSQFRVEIEQKIDQMLKQARKVSLLASDEYSKTMIGDRVSRFIVSRLTIAMDELCERKTTEEDSSAALYEDDMTMALMLSLRDDIEAQAIHACDILQSSMQSAFRDNSVAEVASNGGDDQSSLLLSTSPFEIKDITLHIVDQDTKKRFFQDRSRLDELKSQVREEGERSETVQRLRESLFSVETERKGYREKIAELRATLQELEAQENKAATRIESLSSQLVLEEQKEVTDTKQLNEDIAQTKEAVRYGNLVFGLGGMMKSYSKSIEKATAFKTGREIQYNYPDVSSSDNDSSAVEPLAGETILLRAMEDYLSKVRKYFLKEAHCFTQLNQRLTTKTAEVRALESELAQYNSVKGLFATSTIPTQIKQAIERNVRLIQAYKQKLLTHTDHGRVMYEKLLSSLEIYRANTATESESEGVANLFPSNLLAGVPAAIRILQIGDQNCERLAPFVKETSEEEITSSSAKRNPDLIASESEKSPPKASPLRSYVPPKLNWASPKKKKEQEASTPKRKSLLDIQKEELTRSKDHA